MTEDEIEALARAIARSLRPTLRPGVEAMVTMASTLDRMAGALAVRDQQAEAREQRMVDACHRLDVLLAAHAAPTLTVARNPKTDAARDELGEESLTLLSSIARGIRLAPARIARWLRDSVVWIGEHKTVSLLALGGATMALRVLSAWIPGLAPVAAVMEALMSTYAPAEPPK